MSTTKLQAIPRKAGKGVAHQMRAQGMIPAVVYGHHESPVSIAVDTRSFMQWLHKEHARVIPLSIDGQDESVMIKQVEKDVISGHVIHIDFQRVSLHETIHSRIVLTLTGEEELAKRGLVVVQQAHYLDVEGPADEIPERLEIDISHLQARQPMYIKDLLIPATFVVLIHADEVICTATETPLAEASEMATEEMSDEKPKEQE